MVCLPSFCETCFQDTAQVERTGSVEYELFPIVCNSDVTHQFRRYQLSTSVSSNRTKKHQGISGTLATLEPHLVTSFINEFKPILFGEISGSLVAYGLRAPGPHTADVQAHPGATTFPPVLSILIDVSALLTSAHSLPADAFSMPTITDGYARTWWPKHLSLETYVGLTVH